MWNNNGGYNFGQPMAWQPNQAAQVPQGYQPQMQPQPYQQAMASGPQYNQMWDMMQQQPNGQMPMMDYGSLNNPNQIPNMGPGTSMAAAGTGSRSDPYLNQQQPNASGVNNMMPQQPMQPVGGQQPMGFLSRHPNIAQKYAGMNAQQQTRFNNLYANQGRRAAAQFGRRF